MLKPGAYLGIAHFFRSLKVVESRAGIQTIATSASLHQIMMTTPMGRSS